MSIVQFFQLLLRNYRWLIIFPLTAAIGVFYLTRDNLKSYTSNIVIYTGIASGYNIENEGRSDYHVTNSKFDNLINLINSDETHKEVSAKLMAYYLHNPKELQQLTRMYKSPILEELEKAGPSLKGGDIEATEANIIKQLNTADNTIIYRILYGKEKSPFHLGVIAGAKASRMGLSDMVKVDYTIEDPFLCKRTLDFLSDVFMEKYKGMKIGELDDIVSYFEQATEAARQKLANAEEILKGYRSRNNVINYYEQTKYIADHQENLETDETQLKMDIQGYESAISKVEKKLGERAAIQLKSDDIVSNRNLLAKKYGELALVEMNGGDKKQLQSEIAILTQSLETNVTALYGLSNSVEGIPGKSLLDQWLELTVSLEKANSQYDVLTNTKREYGKIVGKFAPMGSELNKLEREVDVAEKEFLNLLHNLNQARLRQKNLMVTESIKVVNAAALPLVPNASKRLVMVIAAFMAALILVLVVLILKEFLDESIGSPARLWQLTGIKTASAFTVSKLSRKVDADKLRTMGINKWLISIIEQKRKATQETVQFLVVPFHPYPKMDVLLTATANTLSKQGVYTAWKRADSDFVPHDHKDWAEWEDAPTDALPLLPSTPKTPQTTVTIADKTYKNGKKKLTADKVEIIQPHVTMMLAEENKPQLIAEEYLNNVSCVYLTIDAGQKLDAYQLEDLQLWKDMNVPIYAILVNTKLHKLEQFLGEIPKKRGFIRTFFKNIVKKYTH